MSRRGLQLSIVALLAGAAVASSPGAASTAGSVGVARFSGPDGEVASARFSTALNRGQLDHVVSPEGMAAVEVAEPEARQIRGMARRAKVDHVVVGRGQRVDDGIHWNVELRSGHSGAALGRYEATSAGRIELEAAAQIMAASVLEDLGASPPLPVERPAELPAVSATAPGGEVRSKEEEEEDEGSDSLGLGLGGGDLPIRIRSDELEVVENDDGRRILFTDNVVVTKGDIRLETDALEAQYPPGSSSPERLVATGHVRVTQKERRARCQKATYTAETETVVCVGQAELREGCDRVRGDEIHFNLTTERVRVLGAPSVVIQPKGAAAEGLCGAGKKS